jgi:hypothetical protein
MKAEIIETKKAFEPIEIKLVIESEEELCDLLLRLNVRAENVDKYNAIRWTKHKSLNTGTDDGGFWKSLWYKAENLNLITS